MFFFFFFKRGQGLHFIWAGEVKDLLQNKVLVVGEKHVLSAMNSTVNQ